MKPIFLLLLWGLLVWGEENRSHPLPTVILSSKEHQWITEHPVVRLASAHNRLPVEAISPEGNYEGITADYISLIEKRTGLKFETSPIKPWNELVHMVKTRELDMLSGAVKTASRKEFAIFTTPIIHHPVVIVTSDRVSFLDGMKSLQGKKIAMPKGFASIEIIKADYPDLDIHIYDNPSESIKAVARGEVYAHLGSLVLAGNAIRDYGISNVKISGETPYAFDLAMGVRDDWPELASILQKTLNTISQEERSEILNRWIPVRIQETFDYHIIWYLLVIFGIVLLLISFYLYKQNHHKKEIEQLNAELEERINLAIWELEQAEIIGKIGTWQHDIVQEKIKVNFILKEIHQLDPKRNVFNMDELKSTLHPDDLDKVNQAYETHLQEKIPFDLYHRLLLKDGTIRHVHVIATTQYDGNGNPLLSRGIVQDVTESILQKEALKKSKERYKKALEDLKQAQSIGKIGSWQYDLIHDKLVVSDEMRRIHGLDQTKETFTEKDLFTTFHPDDLEIVRQALLDHTEKHVPFNIDHRVILPDGTLKYVHAISHTTYDEKEQPLHAQGIVQDVTERVLYEHELKKSSERNRKALQDLEEQKFALDEHAIVAITDVKGTITYVNDKFIAISGYEREELMGKNHRLISSGRHDTDFWKTMYATISQGKSWHAEVCNKKKDGSLYWVDTTVVPFMDRNHQPKSYIAIRTDITERIRQETIVRERDRQLMQQSRLAQMGEMISMIAHQWRQPLGAIASTVINLKMQMELEIYDLNVDEEKEAFQQYLQDSLTDIDSYIQTLTTTIDDFRSFYKSDKKSEEEIIITPIVKALHIVRNSFETTGIRITENHFSEAKISLHENELIQVFLNIFMNAKDNFLEKETPQPEISITSRDIDGKVEVEICDNGGGIPEEILSKIFDPYFSTKEEKNGTGLGLYMSKMIVEEHHGGSLHVHNTEKGACFTIQLTPAGHQNDLLFSEAKE